MTMQASWLTGGRLHLQEGPIDLILRAEGPGAHHAHCRAVARFDGLLAELVAELPVLRSETDTPSRGPVARAMARAVSPHQPAFVTPMAAVAGAVADAVLAAMQAGAGITRAYVNNGGDIAVFLAPGAKYVVALGNTDGMAGRVTIRGGDGIGGIATSGWRGRSQSLGIADAVTVLAATAADADAAATMIANAVDLPDHPAITRRPARDIKADSDLRHMPVTVGVGALTPAQMRRALDRGADHANALVTRGVVAGVALFLHAETRLVGAITPELALARSA